MIKALVPSIGSSTQRIAAAGRSRPNSSPRMPCEGNRSASTARIACSAVRSAMVTGDRSAFWLAAMLERKKGRITAPATSAAATEEKLAPIAPLLAKADPAAGEASFKKLCTACHTATEGGKSGVGPNLYGVVGGPHAHMEGFSYSPGMKAMSGPWTFDELNEWLKKPSSMVKGTRMTFAGINNDKSRADVIAYLRTLSKNPVPLPPAQ